MIERLLPQLRALENVRILENAPLSDYTRFAIGGPADLIVDVFSESALISALRVIRSMHVPLEVVGEGSNLIVSDAGFRGVILRYRADEITFHGTCVTAAAGAVLQDLVDATIARGLAGVHTMTGIPGSVGAAVYGNAGAYGRSISLGVTSVRYYTGLRVTAQSNAECEFQYRESVFKRQKDWVIVSTELQLENGDAGALRAQADDIRRIRDEKYPPTMRCAGSIFKNIILSELDVRLQAQVPSNMVREGKVPAAWFLEQAGVKGMRVGAIQVAQYHANLIYNDGAGTSADLRRVVEACKDRVRERFGGLLLNEEVQYLGFAPAV